MKCIINPQIGNKKWARIFWAWAFWTKFPPLKHKKNKLSKEGTNFSIPTPSRGRPPPHLAVSGPKKLIFVLFFLAWTNTVRAEIITELILERAGPVIF